MNEIELKELIVSGETLTVEFKSDRDPLADAELINTVTCMANAQGGTLLIGVEDDGAVTGLYASRLSSHPELLAALIANRTVPPLTVEVTFDQLTIDGIERTIATVHIPASTQPIATSDGRLLVRYTDTRGNPGCRPLYPNELFSWRADRMQVDVTARPIAGATWADLDPLEFARLRRILEENRGDEILLELSDEELARALGLVQTEGEELTPTLSGLLLLGREAALQRYVPTHEVAFQVMRGTDVAVNTFHRWPLLRTLEWVIESFQVRNEERELNIGLFRVGVPAYDRRGFREAVNNAFIHRDYTQLGTVHVQMHDDHVRISNPGGFVIGIRPDNLLVTDPRARNPRMADAFKRIGLVERTGRGVSIIYQGQLRNGRLPPDYTLSTEANVTAILPGGPADLDFVQLIVTEENRMQRSFTVNELLILAHVWRERTIDTPTAAQLTQRDDASTRSTLENLVEVGLLERRGDKKGRTYLLSASVYREMGHPEAYIRARGFEPLQMEQMIFQYIQAHGQITRREVVELCRLSENQAGYLLKKLTERGELELVGSGRGAHYKLGKTRKNSEKTRKKE